MQLIGIKLCRIKHFLKISLTTIKCPRFFRSNCVLIIFTSLNFEKGFKKLNHICLGYLYLSYFQVNTPVDLQKAKQVNEDDYYSEYSDTDSRNGSARYRNYSGISRRTRSNISRRKSR